VRNRGQDLLAELLREERRALRLAARAEVPDAAAEGEEVRSGLEVPDSLLLLRERPRIRYLRR